METNPKLRRVKDWTIVGVYTGFIYATLSLMPGVWKWLTQQVGRPINYLAVIILTVAGAFLLWYLIFVRRDKNISSYVWFLLIACLYIYGLGKIHRPAEKIHFLEYGLLSYFVFRALRNDIKNRSIYLWTALIVFLLGFLDEGIQWFLPNRYYDIRDVIVNGAAGLLGLGVICFVIKARID